MKRLTLWLLCLGSLFVNAAAWAGGTDSLRYLPVQDGGRIKPYDTFARESLELIHGKTKFKGKDALEVVTTWMVIPDSWEQIELLELRQSGLRQALNLDPKRILYTPAEILGHERLPVVIQELRSARERGEKLNPYFQAVQRLENQLSLFQAIKAGIAVRLVPQTSSDTWLAANELPDELKQKFGQMLTQFVQTINGQSEGEAEAGKALEDAVQDFVAAARTIVPDQYASDMAIKTEVHYNRFHPFKWAWIFYLLAAIGFVAFLVSDKTRWTRMGWIFLSLGMVLHTYGMALRSYLSGRPPVTNMYETVVWVPWGVLLFAAVLYRFQRKVFLPLAACVVAIMCLILTDLAPTVLDDSIQPLEPVLRSTFWLSTHVLIISISYAAFFLAFALGDWVLFMYLRDESKYAKEIASTVNAIYRSIQIGVVLLAAGTILGGVWAAYSWGRFWGWDPKETWAFIALMGYLALLHGRLAGLVKNFGMAAGAVVSFSLVIMAWYGVNFVLGAGLHSYGFGAGGVEWVSGFVALHLIYVVFAATVRRSRLKGSKVV
ncbi:MAG: cytochrome c biogenesis protein [Bdellovibrionales bacterium]